jgi:hypothetical protein
MSQLTLHPVDGGSKKHKTPMSMPENDCESLCLERKGELLKEEP